MRPRPKVSIVVVGYNIPRELPRTLVSLSPKYQRHIDPKDYEIIVIDNGSAHPINLSAIPGLEANCHLIRIEEGQASLASAANIGLAHARGEVIGLMVDGARMATPGLLHFARQGACLYENSVVACLGWHLGHDFQRWAIQSGYDQSREDALLNSIDWQNNGYRLFEIGTMDESSVDGWVAPIAESNALFMHRATWKRLGGLDERFNAPGGGLVNLDLFRRAAELPDCELVILLGEATFHQLHGGVATNAPPETFHNKFSEWAEQYQEIRHRLYEVPRFRNSPTYIGTLPTQALLRFLRAGLEPSSPHLTSPPLGPEFDQTLWAVKPFVRPHDATVAALVDLAHAEFHARRYSATAAVARLICEKAPEETEPKRLLSLTSPWLSAGLPSEELRIEYHLALGDAHRILGEIAKSGDHYHAALKDEKDQLRAHIGLASLRMPGEFYYDWLKRLYATLAPSTIIEIGVGEGRSLACVQAPTTVIGVDPAPKAICQLHAHTLLIPETSDKFFARRGPDSILSGRPLDIGFIDGAHLYEQALKDFINLEQYCGSRSMILIHDTIPVDEPTQRRVRETQFWTGDIWKLVLCLSKYRPDLDVFTIATAWSGLTVVIGLDPGNRVLSQNYDEAVAHYIDMPFSDIANDLGPPLNITPNDWNFVREKLRARNILP